MSARDLKRDLIDMRISLAMRPEHMRGGVKIGYLAPEHWEEVRRRLQATYRLATGETHATLIVEPAPRLDATVRGEEG
jgi:hypothetical protein